MLVSKLGGWLGRSLARWLAGWCLRRSYINPPSSARRLILYQDLLEEEEEDLLDKQEKRLVFAKYTV
jgi:hypothetical protein